MTASRLTRGLLAAALALTLAVTLGAASAAAADRCRETTLPGAWKSAQSGNVWTFHPDGRLSCEGACRFVQVTGEPVSWAYEPHANIWSQPIEHLKLTFTKITFDGVFGSFRCLIDDDGLTLRLVAEDDGTMVFRRQ